MEKRKREESGEGENKRPKIDNGELNRLLQKASEQQIKNVLTKIVSETETQARAVELLKAAVCVMDSVIL